MRTIIVGDVHGCREEFVELLQKVNYVQGQDDLISVGDLLDRGPDPVGTVALAMEMKARLVMGNHEEKALRWLRHEAKVKADPKYKNPMKAVPPERMAEWRALTEAQVEYLKSAPHWLDFGDIGAGGAGADGWLAVHAGFESGYPLDKQKPDCVTRVRYVNTKGEMVGYTEGSLDQPKNTVYWTQMWEGPKSVVYGHAVRSTTNPCIERFTDSHRTVKTIGIDTGCCFGGRLTAMIMNGDEPLAFVQVQAKRQYYPWPEGFTFS